MEPTTRRESEPIADAPSSTTDVALARRVAHLHRTFESGRTRDRAFRQRQLTGVLEFLYRERKGVQDALRADLARSRGDADAEALTVALETLHAKRHLAAWMRDRKVDTPFLLAPGTSFVRREPLGVVLIFGAWNYPVHLCLMPLVGALAAGNTVLLKPSELASRSSALLAERLPRYLDADALAVVEGGADVATELLRIRFDHIFYTGNGAVGSRVMASAAAHLTPVTLELGGKSPVLVDATADLVTSARRIAIAKWMNAGQTCVAPDYVLVERGVEAAFLRTLQATIREFYGPDPKASPAYGRIIDERHTRRLAGLLGAGEVVTGGEIDVPARYVAPTVLTNVAADDPVMKDEIFGPILPVLPVDSMAEAVSFVRARPKPLALYVFTRDRAVERAVLDGTSAGGTCVNHAGVHLANAQLPFGGVGASGMGAYHGEASFDTFSHRRSVLKKPFFFDPPVLYPRHRERSERNRRP